MLRCIAGEHHHAASQTSRRDTAGDVSPLMRERQGRNGACAEATSVSPVS